MPSPPTVTYTIMTVDEVSGHSWVSTESAHCFTDVEREKLADEQNKKVFWAWVKTENELLKPKSTKRHSVVLMKYRFVHGSFQAFVMIKAQLRRNKHEQRQDS